MGGKVTSESLEFKGTEVGGPEVWQGGAQELECVGSYRESQPLGMWGVCQEQGAG